MLLIAFLLILNNAVVRSDPAPPATRPATRPMGGSVHGQVTITGNLGLQKPDLSRVVVFLADDPALTAASNAPAQTFVIQRNKEFHPNFLVVERNTSIEFPNWDRFEHNVFSRSAAAPAFDLERYPYGQSKSRVFEKTGVVQLFCNIHPSMRAVIYVTPNSFFTRCDSEGHFTLSNIPPGKYSIAAWQDRCGEQQLPVEIASDQSAEITLELGEKHDHVVRTGDSGGTYGVDRGLSVKRSVLNLPVVTECHPAPPESQPK
jgi:plastocyanin